tara:strand:+ start:17 stop:685 length:669 start_codon:yes stop_codon:yes gene_type:complete
MSKAPKQKQSQAEKALAETGVKQFQLTAPLLQRSFDQLKALTQNKDALAKRLVQVGRKDMFDALEQSGKVLSDSTFGTDLIANNTPNVQLADGISREAEKQAQEFSRKANVSLGSVASGQLNQELRLAGNVLGNVNRIFAQEQRAKQQNREQVFEAAGKAASLIGGQLVSNAVNPSTNIFGRSVDPNLNRQGQLKGIQPGVSVPTPNLNFNTLGSNPYRNFV